jgi:hypothetical protein
VAAAWATQCISSSGVDATVSVQNDGDGSSTIGFFVMSHGECTGGSHIECSFSTTGFEDIRETDGNYAYHWEQYIPMIVMYCMCV